MTMPRKTLRWALARFLLLWGFYRSTPARVGTARTRGAAVCHQQHSILVSAPDVNRNGAHAHARHGATATPACRGVQHTLPKAQSEKLSRSDLVVRLQWRLISTVQVRVGVCHTSVAEGYCVTARWGGKQPEADPRSVG